MPSKSYIIHKDNYNKKTSSKLVQKYKEDPEFRQKALERSKNQHRLKLGTEILELKEERDKLEDELNTLCGEYNKYKKEYQDKTDTILTSIKNISDRIKDIRQQRKLSSNNNSDTESINEELKENE